MYGESKRQIREINVFNVEKNLLYLLFRYKNPDFRRKDVILNSSTNLKKNKTTYKLFRLEALFISYQHWPILRPIEMKMCFFH